MLNTWFQNLHSSTLNIRHSTFSLYLKATLSLSLSLDKGFIIKCSFKFINFGPNIFLNFFSFLSFLILWVIFKLRSDTFEFNNKLWLGKGIEVIHELLTNWLKSLKTLERPITVDTNYYQKSTMCKVICVRSMINIYSDMFE